MRLRHDAIEIDPERLARFELATGIRWADLDLAAHLPLFAGLDGAVLIGLLADARVRQVAGGTVLFLQDEPASQFYVLVDGWVRLYRETADGHESTIGVFTRGESFAEAAIFQSNRFPVSAVVVEDARLMVVPAEPFVRQLRHNPELSLNILASMSRHLRQLVQQIEQLTVRSSTERLADFLLKLTHHGAGSATVELPWDKALIAARLGMQPETLSRSLAKLRRVGVDTQGSRVTIRDLPALRQFSAGDGTPPAGPCPPCAPFAG